MVDAINGAILRRLRVNEGSSGAIRLMNSVEEIARLMATRHPQLVGETLGLVAELRDGTVLTITERDDAWNDLLTTLDRSGRLSFSSREWLLRLFADSNADGLMLIEQDTKKVEPHP